MAAICLDVSQIPASDSAEKYLAESPSDGTADPPQQRPRAMWSTAQILCSQERKRRDMFGLGRFHQMECKVPHCICGSIKVYANIFLVKLPGLPPARAVAVRHRNEIQMQFTHSSI